ncbi:hypothetical protein Trydic_g8038 [Trypoxylus dichotomus]
MQEAGSLRNRKQSGRKRATTANENQLIVSWKQNRFLTIPEITQQLEISERTPIPYTIVKRRLLTAGLRGKIAVKKPLLKQPHKKIRLEWAIQHKNWTIEQWYKVLWTKESKFRTFDSKR